MALTAPEDLAPDSGLILTAQSNGAKAPLTQGCDSQVEPVPKDSLSAGWLKPLSVQKLVLDVVLSVVLNV